VLYNKAEPKPKYNHAYLSDIQTFLVDIVVCSMKLGQEPNPLKGMGLFRQAHLSRLS